MRLTEGEERFLNHNSRWGSDGWPIRKVGRSWHWEDSFGYRGAPVSYKTKREAGEAVERYIDLLLDKKAGRI
jgi:hypothetical protein